jgi:alkylated DNA repair dioxygenase AlkB
VSKTDLTIEHVENNRQPLLAALNARGAVVRDMVRGVGRHYATGFYLYGPAGTAKTHTVRHVLETELQVPYVYKRGHLTPLGLFELLADNREEVIVLDDVGELFTQPIAVQILLAALEQPKAGRERHITYKRKGEESSFGFRGGLIAISNLELHDAGMLQALKSRVNTLRYDPPPEQLAALMLSIAQGGWPPGGKTVSPAEADEVARHVIGEVLRLQTRMDLRLFVDKALPLFVQYKDDEAECHWKDLISASIEESLSEPKYGFESPVTRTARVEAESRIAHEIYRAHPADREARDAEWVKRTGRSTRAFYRRLQECPPAVTERDPVESVESVRSVTTIADDTKEAPVVTTFRTHDLDGHEFLQGRIPDALHWEDVTFEAAWALHPDVRPSIHLHGRTVVIPRWQQAYGRNYRFSNQVSEALPGPAALEPLLAWVKSAIDARLNGVLVNWYEGPNHHIGPHNDSTEGLVEDSPIVTVSFGETRTFRLTRGQGGGIHRRDFPAPQGTVFVMPYATNLAWKHSVPKSTRFTGRRISVTFRAFD